MLNACNQETEFETVIVSSSDSILIRVLTDTGSIGDLAPTFEFKNLISKAGYEIHGNNKCSKLISEFVANIENERVLFKIPETSLNESELVNFHLKGTASSGEIFCINLRKEFTYIKNDLESDIYITLASPSRSLSNSSSVGLIVGQINEGRFVELFTDSECTSRSSNIVNYEGQVVQEGESSVELNFELNSPGSYNFFVKVTNPLSQISMCSSRSANYTYDNVPPILSSVMFLPSLSSSFQSFDNQPTIKVMGSFNIGDSIKVFSGSACNTLLDTKTISEGDESFINITQSLSLANGESQQLSIKAVDQVGNETNCSGPIQYTKLSDVEPTLNPSVNSSGDLEFEFPDLVFTSEVSNGDYNVTLFPQTNNCSGVTQVETMRADKSVIFSNVFPTPGIYSNFSVRLSRTGFSDETTCFSSYSFRTISSSPVSLSLSTSTSSGRDLDFNVSGVLEGGTIYLYQNSGCIGSPWGSSTIVDGTSSSIQIENRSISSPGNYNFTAKLIADGGVDTGCSAPIGHTIDGVSSSWSENTVEPGFGDTSIFSNLSWDFLSGDTIKVYNDANCTGGVVYTENVSSSSSLISIDLQPYLNSGANTTFSFELNSDRGCEAEELVFNLLEPSLSIPSGSSGVDGSAEIKIDSLPLARRMDLALYNTGGCSGSADFNVLDLNLSSDRFYTFSSTGRTPLSNLGPNSYSVKVKLYNSTESESIEKCLGTINYNLLPLAPTSLTITSTGNSGELSFSNSENLDGGKLIIFSGENCDTELGVSSYSGGTASYNNSFSTGGSYSFSSKKRKEVSGQNYDSPCSGELATYDLDMVPPGNVDNFSIITSDVGKLTYGTVDLDFSISATNFEAGEKISLYQASDCTGSPLVINDSGTPRSEIDILTSGTASLTLKHNPGNYYVENQSVYLLREDSSGNKNCHSSSPVNFFIYPSIGFGESTTANPGFGTSVYMGIGYATQSNKTIYVYKSTDCSGSQITSSVLDVGNNLKSLGMDFSINSSGNTDYSFKFSGGSCFPFGLTYKMLDLTLSFPNGTSGVDTKPDVQVSGDMSSVNHIYLYPNSSCSGSADTTKTFLNLGTSDSVTFGPSSDRDDLTVTGINEFYVYVYLKKLDGSSLGQGTCIGPANYTLNDTNPPGAFTSFAVSEKSNNRAFENNLNFELELRADNFELNEVVTVHSDSSCSSAALDSKTLDSGDVDAEKINLTLNSEDFSGFSFSNSNNHTEERKVYIKRSDSDGNSSCFSNEANNEVISLYIYQTPTLDLNYSGTGISAPTDQNNLRFQIMNFPGMISSGTGFDKEIYIYKDPRCELAYGKKYDVYYSVSGHGGESFPELIDKTGKYRMGVKIKYIGRGDLVGESLVSGCIQADEFEIIPTIINSVSELQAFLSAANVSNLENLGWYDYTNSEPISYKRHLKLNSDLDLSQGDTDCDTINTSSTNNWTPVPYFNGTFDGGGKTICGLNLDQSENLLGFFEQLGKKSIVFNLRFMGSLVSNSSTNVNSATGILAGESRGIIERISLSNFTGATPITSTVMGNYNVGGLIGRSSGARVKKVESYADVSCIDSNLSDSIYCDGHGESFGGIVGIIEPSQTINTSGFDNLDYVDSYSRHGVVLNSLVHAEVKARSKVGGIVGSSEGLVMYSYVANKNANSGSPGGGVSGDDKVGGIVGEIQNEHNYNYGVMYSVAVTDVLGNSNTAGVVGLASTNYAVHVSYHSSSNCYNHSSSGAVATCHSSSSITPDLFKNMTTSNCYSTFKFDCEGTYQLQTGMYPSLRINGIDGFPLGRGTREDPIIISNQNDWAQIANSSKFRSLHIHILPKDSFGNPVENIFFQDMNITDDSDQTFDYGLTLNGSSGIYDFFTGTLDGNYYSLINLKQYSNNRYIGSILNRSAGEFQNIKIIGSLFTCGQNDLSNPSDDTTNNQNECAVVSRSSTGGTFYNIILENVELRITRGSAALFSANSYNNHFENISIKDSIIKSTTSSGGYVGSLLGTGTNTYIKNVQALNLQMENMGNYSGGLAGFLQSNYTNPSLIENSFVELDLIINPLGCSRTSFGGILGYGYLGTVIKNSHTDGHIRQTSPNNCASNSSARSTSLGGIYGYSRHCLLLNSYSSLNINKGDDGNPTPGAAESDNCAGASGTVGGGPDFKVQNSFFIGSLNCYSNIFGIGQHHTPLLKGGTDVDNNYWFNDSTDSATNCFPSNSSCLTNNSYTWTDSEDVLNFVKGNSNPSLFDSFNSSNPSSGGLGWNENIWNQEENSLPKLKLFNP